MSDRRLFDFLFEQNEKFPLEKAFGHRVGSDYHYFSTSAIIEQANRLSLGLLELGLKPGDTVASSVYKTTPEWMILDFALLQIGVWNVPVYPTISPREYAYILNDSAVQFCFVGEGDLLQKMQTSQKEAPQLKEIFTLYESKTARNWTTLLRDGDFAPLEPIRAAIKADDIATIIYTSGTTGNPKGVMLTHRNIVFNIETMRKLIPIEPGQIGLSFLPVCHIFERAVVYAYTAYCVQIFFSTPDQLGGDSGDLKLVKPHFFATVPRLLEKVYEKIEGKGRDLTGIKKGLFFWALKLAETWDFDQKPTGISRIKWAIADKLIFSKWREALGGNIIGILTGASACPFRIMQVFNAAGIAVREGYGMSEAAPALSFNRFTPHGAKLGTVGPLVEGVEVYIETGPDYRPGEGEILAKSDGIMPGYYKQPEKTAEVLRVIDGKTWLITGDVGMLVEGENGMKFLKITDRKKELLKTSLGKYVAPGPIESRMRESNLIEQAMVVGENLKFVSAIILPAKDALLAWCAHKGIETGDFAQLLAQKEVVAKFQKILDQLNPEFSHHEQVKRFTLASDSWETVKSDGSEAELTPTMKLKRRVILNKYARDIEKMYL